MLLGGTDKISGSFFCDGGAQGLSTSHNYSHFRSHCEISTVTEIVISQILLCPVFMRMTYNSIIYVLCKQHLHLIVRKVQLL